MEDVRADYVDALLIARPSLHNEPQDKVRRLAALLWRLDAKRYRHRAGDGTLGIPFQELDAVFGARKFNDFNRTHRVLVIHDQLHTHRQTKRYSVHPDILAMDERYLSKYEAFQAELTDIVWEDGSTRSALGKAVVSKDKRGNTATVWGHAGVCRSVPVDVEQLRALCDYYTRELGKPISLDDEQRHKRRRRLARKLIADAHTTLAGRGEVLIQYREADSGRLYALGLNMQNVHKMVRFAALHGMYDYDIANCHFSIFRQMAARSGLQCHVIDDYLSNKDARRRELAGTVGCTKEQIKECLLAIMYGASSFDDDDKALPSILRNDPACVAKFQAHPWLTALRNEVKAAGKVILRDWPHRNRGLFVNEARKAIGRDTPQHRILAHLMQGAEAIILRAMLSAVPDSSDIVLLQHDGFTSRKRLDPTALEAAVLRDTGYVIRLEERAISAPNR